VEEAVEGTRLELIPLRFAFTAREPVHFPAGKAANVLRGAFGLALAQVAAAREYARLFQPRSEDGPSGLADPPRPFVFRARHLDGVTVPAGGDFEFGVNLFTLDPEARESLVRAFEHAGREGFGTRRGKADLRGAEAAGGIVSLDLTASEPPPGRIRVRFLTPTELKHEGRVVERPDFAILFARVRDRISTLRALYGSGPLEIDFQGRGQRAAAVRLLRCELRRGELERRSSRTGQSHSIGGFTGFAEYEGEFAEFLPYLEAARWTGVGRQAVWGKGEIAVDPAP
jgi:CRISPR-associated endoribonuclease Cas6